MGELERQKIYRKDFHLLYIKKDYENADAVYRIEHEGQKGTRSRGMMFMDGADHDHRRVGIRQILRDVDCTTCTHLASDSGGKGARLCGMVSPGSKTER